MSYTTLFHSGLWILLWKYPLSMDIIDIMWKYPCSVDIFCTSCMYPYFIEIICNLWKYPRSVDIIRNSCIYPYFLDIILISWKYPRSMYINSILYVSSLTFYYPSESDWCITYFPVFNLICYSVPSSFFPVHFCE